MLSGILILVWLVCIAMLWNEGMWSNCITLVNVLLSAMLAMNQFEPLANALDDMAPSFTFVWDYLSIWFIFFISFILLRGATDQTSKHRVKFIMPIEQSRSRCQCRPDWLDHGVPDCHFAAHGSTGSHRCARLVPSRADVE